MSRYYAGWGLTSGHRRELLRMCPPAHAVERCEHVTFQLVSPGAPPPPQAEIIVRGMFDNEIVQCLVVQVNGVVIRPSDGLLFHITMSHIEGFPSRLAGEQMQMFPQLVHQISPFPIMRTVPFVREIM